jgi:hypothetical protein
VCAGVFVLIFGATRLCSVCRESAIATIAVDLAGAGQVRCVPITHIAARTINAPCRSAEGQP